MSGTKRKIYYFHAYEAPGVSGGAHQQVIWYDPDEHPVLVEGKFHLHGLGFCAMPLHGEPELPDELTLREVHIIKVPDSYVGHEEYFLFVADDGDNDEHGAVFLWHPVREPFGDCAIYRHVQTGGVEVEEIEKANAVAIQRFKDEWHLEED